MLSNDLRELLDEEILNILATGSRLPKQATEEPMRGPGPAPAAEYKGNKDGAVRPSAELAGVARHRFANSEDVAGAAPA
tara:strand:+ start:814 stop:1050 length:237 start_codon:yes stop_codon:yes gene_type:complete